MDTTALWVALAGAAGVLSRYGVGTAVRTDALPWATVAINVVGSFMLGLLVELGRGLPSGLRTALAVGFLGGFTTFSTFSLDVFLDLDSGRAAEGLAYLAGSVVLGIAAAGVGYRLGHTLARG